MNLFSKRFIVPTLVIAFFYIILITYSMNIRILKDTLFGDYNVIYKFKILFTLLQGMWTAMSSFGLTILFLIALLTGANLTLLFNKMSVLKNYKSLRLVVGSNSLFGIVGSGCASCGLPILSFLGLSGSVMYLPFHGAELSYISLIFLAISFYLLVKNTNQACVLAKKI
ncbi:hypothetical protein AUK04_00030 [Candidatus Roizmanbacteria bacterium CG2_30_33_16]|uniref:Uncharacterized protein n=1 Tax=Candidatus Roizmanbacteria bacterium CG2_30_33_16 TaxID=1805340 RepID=A0A1J5HPY1_9BACT|nr:hypothetical protein [Candidatus Roizmanbacteria bacterium]OIP86796.1 MAG: hypothetical protein AUK04_00030 [Candidatus Roizmanbacteria bacterium CG2_30_33_16]